MTVGEVERMKLKADLVNLSACETGLGKVYAGEGSWTYQCFYDRRCKWVVFLYGQLRMSPSIFMDQFYGHVSEGKTFSHSLSQVKRDFISGKFGDEYMAPYYWAPFVYYGL